MDALESTTWECVLDDPASPERFGNVSTSPLSETSPGARLPWGQELPAVEGTLSSLSTFSEPLHLSSFSSFSLHFNGVASQRFLFQAAERCISLTPLHTWFNFQLAWDARAIIRFLRLLGVLDVPSFSPVPPQPLQKLFRVGCQADMQVFSHPLPSLVLFYTICSELKVWAARRDHLEITVLLPLQLPERSGLVSLAAQGVCLEVDLKLLGSC